MKKINLAIFTLLIAALCLSSCSKDLPDFSSLNLATYTENNVAVTTTTLSAGLVNTTKNNLTTSVFSLTIGNGSEVFSYALKSVPAVGSYAMSSVLLPVFTNAGGVDYTITSATLTITYNDGSTVAGNFTITGTKNGTTKTITNGTFKANYGTVNL